MLLLKIQNLPHLDFPRHTLRWHAPHWVSCHVRACCKAGEGHVTLGTVRPELSTPMQASGLRAWKHAFEHMEVWKLNLDSHSSSKRGFLYWHPH